MPELQAVVEGTGDEGERPLIETIDALLGRRLRVVTHTQRHFLGTFTCFDHFANVLLFDAVEKLHEDGKGRERTLNQIILPLTLVQSAEVLVASDDRVLQIMLEDDLDKLAVA